MKMKHRSKIATQSECVRMRIDDIKCMRKQNDKFDIDVPFHLCLFSVFFRVVILLSNRNLLLEMDD